MPSPTVLIALILALLLAGAGAIVGYKLGDDLAYARGKRDGAAAEAASINAQGRAQAQDAEAARQPAYEPGALSRLKAQWCRDCTP